jgi:hypothetical protein
MAERQAAHMPELDALPMGPQALARMQLRGLCRQALYVEALRHPIREELLDDVTAMHGGPILHAHQAAGHVRRSCARKATTSAESSAHSWP